jgi:hypothetical protein
MLHRPGLPKEGHGIDLRDVLGLEFADRLAGFVRPGAGIRRTKERLGGLREGGFQSAYGDQCRDRKGYQHGFDHAPQFTCPRPPVLYAPTA